jgi:acyl transferase domain-containing protein
MTDWTTVDEVGGQEIAIIGMAGRFPGAQTLDEFWHNLVNGVESISTFSDEQVLAAGVDPALVASPYYVKAGGVLKDIELFDAAFFGFYPREAALTDPQQRLFLECAWEALESAGYDPEAYDGPIGVYAGAGISTYLLFNLLSSQRIESTDQWAVVMNNDKDFLPTRVSYKLNLRGPSVNVQTACSTSLVAVHLACQSLLSYESDMALAGGSTIRIPQERGYLYQEGGIASPDGHCRAFDAQAQGTVGGNGVGVVVLKRLADALADGDYIHAVIKGSAINNDGSLKVGYTAPSVDGQAEVIARAMAVAQVDPATIGYVECHGTGTAIGDPIEIAALTEAFQSATSPRRPAGQYCAIGSLKTNVGHMDTAAGVGGLIKAALALKHKQLPPSLHYTRPNPNMDLTATPFYVNAQLAEWQADGAPRRAGVSSFGIGGTNAHVVLEEAPAREPSSASRPWQALYLSAKTETALEQASWNLTDYLMQHPDVNLADVAYTTQVGRRAWAHRRVIVCRDVEDALRAVQSRDPKRVFTGHAEPGERPVAFMFTGQGAQYVGMGKGLYESEPVFRQQVDYCADALRAHLGLDLRDLLYPPPERADEAAERLQQTAITQPALFVIEYALARLWMAWGVQPDALIGHSIGEYVAACLAGVFSLDDALALVAARGRMMQALPAGSMLSVPLAEAEVRPCLDERLSVAVLNAPGMSVVSGPTDAVDELARRLADAGVDCRPLHTSHAFHSPMMDPILDAFTERVAQVELHAPTILLISNVTGTWMTPDQATDPAYWASHLRQPVRFGQGVEELLKEPSRVLLEVGPGQTLTTLARRHPAATADRVVLPTLRHPKDEQPDAAFILGALGRLWLAGVRVDWAGFYADERRYRLPLPTYPFERRRYFIELDPTGQTRKELRKEPRVQDWFYLPSWKRAPLPRPAAEGEGNWLLFGELGGLTAQVADRLQAMGRQAITVTPGGRFAQTDPHHYLLNPQEPEHYERLLRALAATGAAPAGVVYLWGMGHGERPVTEALDGGFYPLLYLAQAMGAGQPEAGPVELVLVTDGLHDVTGGESLSLGAAPLLALGRVIAQEYPLVRCRAVDMLAVEDGARLADWLIRECLSGADAVVAYRGRHRWVQAFERIPQTQAAPGKQAAPGAGLRPGGVYLITGGLGRIGLTLAEQLARRAQARLALVGRTPLPPRDEWDGWLAAHDEADATSARIRAVRACEALGAEVLLLQADVADRAQLEQAIAETQSRFGALHGVIHAAGGGGRRGGGVASGDGPGRLRAAVSRQATRLAGAGRRAGRQAARFRVAHILAGLVAGRGGVCRLCWRECLPGRHRPAAAPRYWRALDQRELGRLAVCRRAGATPGR